MSSTPRTFNADRAKRAREVILALLAEGAPCPFWVAIRLQDGKTHGAAYPTKATAMAHTSNPNEFAFLCVQTPLDAPGIGELISYLRFVEAKENYWARTDPNVHVAMPKFGPVSSGDAEAYRG
jgi:hypothetical protein